MKAYKACISNDPDLGVEFVFAENIKEAKVKAWETQLSDQAESYINLRVKRFPCLDGKENAKKVDIFYILFLEGCNWDNTRNHPIPEETSKEEFITWAKENGII